MDLGSVAQIGSLLSQSYATGEPASEDQLRRLRALSGDDDATTGRAAGRSAGRASDALEMARSTVPYSYEYTPEVQAKAGQPSGTQYGLMTTDLKRTPAGRSVVKRDPKTGYEVVDTPRLTMQNTAAIGQLVREQDQRQQRQKAALRQLWETKAQRDYERAQADLDRRLAQLRSLGG